MLVLLPLILGLFLDDVSFVFFAGEAIINNSSFVCSYSAVFPLLEVGVTVAAECSFVNCWYGYACFHC